MIRFDPRFFTLKEHSRHRREEWNSSRGSASQGQRPRFSREVRVLYEDEAIVALDKPPGLLAVPIKGSAVPSAWSLLAAELKHKRERVFVVHRIDRFVSGVLLFAKTPADREVLVQQFLEHTPTRQYLAVVRGHLEEPAGRLVHYFRREAMHQQLSGANDRKASRAELYYSVEREFPPQHAKTGRVGDPIAKASQVRVELVTGLQNQIRAQFAAIGHPVIGDRKYRPGEAGEPLIDRVALHAARLECEHPRSGENVSIDCRPPADFQNLIRSI